MGGKVHDGIGAAQRLRQFSGIRNIADNQFKPFGQFAMTGTQIVVDDDFVALALQDVRGVTANVSSSPNYQNGQASSRNSIIMILEPRRFQKTPTRSQHTRPGEVIPEAKAGI
jgi:hypothetical protein